MLRVCSASLYCAITFCSMAFVRVEPAIAVVAGLETEVPASTGHQVDQAFRGHELR